MYGAKESRNSIDPRKFIVGDKPLNVNSLARGLDIQNFVELKSTKYESAVAGCVLAVLLASENLGYGGFESINLEGHEFGLVVRQPICITALLIVLSST